MAAKRPPIPWHEALPGTTHALWSYGLHCWYFWKVEPNGTTYHDNIGSGRWRHHFDQGASREKLANYLRRGLAIHIVDDETETQDEEGYCPMNLENAALLVREDITTVQVSFPDHPDRTFTYILHDSIDANPGDDILVQRKERLEVGTIATKDAEAQINVNSNTQYKWVIGSVTDMRASIDDEIKKTDIIAKALKQRQASNVRGQILQQFGVANAAELMALGQDNQQSA